ncbi:MAG: hypothetical protein FWG20_07360 [Candidatus Cloacimonetes bacterium]|nr:hypothetical protein [Candidatus Cloacimonadota bacterium]
MEISDLKSIGKITCSKRDESKQRFIFTLKAAYQRFLPEIKDVFLIYTDHRVRYGKIDILHVINETKAEIDIEDDDLKDELLQARQVGVYLDKEGIEQLENDDSVYFDPIGMAVIWNEQEVARIVDFFWNGAHDVYEIKMSDERVVLIPDVLSFVIETDVEKRYIRVVDLDQFLE